MGVPCLKSVSDMWNYQEILTEVRPTLVVEFGTHSGGSALFFAEILRLIDPHSRVLTVDINHQGVAERARKHPRIEFLESDSTHPRVAQRIRELRKIYPDKTFFIVDSDHSKGHVLAELETLRDLTVSGDYLVVEDSNINGHPVLPDWGPGPYEAIAEYRSRYPEDYIADTNRESKFGFTFAPSGFMIRR